MTPEATRRVQKELANIQRQPPFGTTARAREDKLDEIELSMFAPEESVYEGGLFKLLVRIPERYPSEPPKVEFITPIYHPNIDNMGRICLHLLKASPLGTWDSRLTLSALCLGIGLLMAEPNPDDALMMDIAKEFKESRELFNQKARDWTQIHAVEQPQNSRGFSKRKRSSMGTSRKRSLSLATIIESDSELGDEENNVENTNRGRKIFKAVRRNRRKSEGSRKFAPLDLSAVVLNTPESKMDRMEVELELELELELEKRQKRRLE